MNIFSYSFRRMTGCLALLVVWLLLIGLFVPMVVWIVGVWPRMPFYSAQCGLIGLVVLAVMRMIYHGSARWKEEANEREWARRHRRNRV